MYLRRFTYEIIQLKSSPPQGIADRWHGVRAWRPNKALRCVVGLAPLCLLIFAGMVSCFQLLEGLAFDGPAAQAQALQSASVQLMLEEQAALRGFAATNDRLFLEPLHATRKPPSVYTALAGALIGLHLQDGEQDVRVLSALDERWLATVERPLLHSRLSTSQVDVLLRQGTTIVDTYRSQSRELADAIARRVVERQHARKTTFTAVAIASAVGILICFVGMVSAAREFAFGKSATLNLVAFQRALLPPELPRVAGCGFDALYESGPSAVHVGGDWYDAVRLIDGRILISIGDVAGSGQKAALAMGVVRQIMRGIAQLHAHPALMLDAADRALRLEHPDVFVTAWVGVVDLVTQSLTYASAGHPPALLCTSIGTVDDLSDRGLPLGLRQAYQSKATTIALPDHSTLVLYTDGLTEATHDLIAGDALLHEAAAQVARTPWERPAEALRRYVLGAAASDDDLAILAVRFNFVEAEAGITRFTFDVRDAEAARHARGVLVATLTTRGFPPIEKLNAELVFSELIGNVFRHANTGDKVEIAIDCTGPQTILHVLDRGLGFSHVSRLPFDPLSESGRGVFLVAQMTDDFTVSARPGGGSHVRAVLVGRLPRSLQAEDVLLPSLLPAFT